MKIVLVLLLTLYVSMAHAGDDNYFTDLPSKITKTEAIAAMKKAATQRKWSSSILNNNKLQIKLNHRNYKAWLIFSFSDDKIFYQDLTTYDGIDEFEDLEEGSPVPVPSHWLKNIKKDTIYYFNQYGSYSARAAKVSPEDVEKKLEGLKTMYDKQLITEVEYQQKKKDILSQY